MGHSASNWYFGRDPTCAFDGVVPFSFNLRQKALWFDKGGNGQLSYKRFQRDQNQWFSLAEAPMQNFIINHK